MNCRHCSKEIQPEAVGCISCGMDPRTGDKYCSGCGVETKPEQIICVKCSVGLSQNQKSIQSFGKTGKQNTQRKWHQKKRWRISIGAIIVFTLFGILAQYLSKERRAFHEALVHDGELNLQWTEKRGQNYANIRMSFYFQDGKVVDYQTNERKYSSNSIFDGRFINLNSSSTYLRFSTPMNKSSSGDWNIEMKVDLDDQQMQEMVNAKDTFDVEITITEESAVDLDAGKFKKFDREYDGTAILYMAKFEQEVNFENQ